MNKMNKKGFTLIEMLVVIAIIAVLVAIIVPTVASSTLKAKGAADAANLRSLTAEAVVDYLDTNKIPSDYSMVVKSDPSGTKTTQKIAFTTDSNGSLIGTVGGKYVLADFVKVAEGGKALVGTGSSGT